jgi:outer membrane immunogenic protein
MSERGRRKSRRRHLVLGANMKIKLAVVIAALLASLQSSALGQALPLVIPGTTSASANSGLVGVQAGYNWQQGAWVYGLAADISGTSLKSQSNLITGDGFHVPTTLTGTVDWYGTARGRLGWSSGPLLFYGTGGLAYGDLNLNSSLTFAPTSLNAQMSTLRAGWVAGGGIEYMANSNVLLNLEYQYVDLGTVNVAAAAALGQTSSLSASERGRFSAVTFGLSWLFAPGRGPWEGGYVGGHVGGAWGNDTNASYAISVPAVSDTRLKRDIVLIGRLDNGLGLYRYRYLWSDTVYVGVMAQEVALIRPDAVVHDPMDDYLRVDYLRLGLRLMTLPAWEAVGKGQFL